CLCRLLECVGDALADFVQRTDSRYLAEGRGLLVAAARPVRIVVDQGTRLLLIHRQAVPDGFFAVVVALHQGFACDVIDVGGLGRVEGDVIAAAAGRMDAASAHALDDVLVRHHDFDDEVQGDTGFLQGVGLRNGAGEAVEQITVLAIGLLQAVAHQADDDVIGDQFAGIHDFLCLESQWRLGLDGGAQHVAVRDLRNAEFFGNERSLRSLASAGRAEQDQSHEYLPEYAFQFLSDAAMQQILHCRRVGRMDCRNETNAFTGMATVKPHGGSSCSPRCAPPTWTRKCGSWPGLAGATRVSRTIYNRFTNMPRTRSRSAA